MPTPVHSPTDPKQHWNAFRDENPDVHVRTAAGRLGVSEAELAATGCGKHVTRLKSDWSALLGAHDALVDAYRHDDQSIGRSIAPVEENSAEGPDEAIDVEALLEEWSEPEDTHDFFPLLQDCDVSRRKASHSSVRRP